MSGARNGCQVIIKEIQPLAAYVHCSAHVANLIIQQAVGTVSTIRKALHIVNETGVLFKRSGKLQVIIIYSIEL